jgi:hypothetical protein
MIKDNKDDAHPLGQINVFHSLFHNCKVSPFPKTSKSLILTATQKKNPGHALLRIRETYLTKIKFNNSPCPTASDK